MIGKLREAFRHFVGLQNGNLETRKRKLDRYSDEDENEEESVGPSLRKRICVSSESSAVPVQYSFPASDLSKIVTTRVANVCQPVLDKMNGIFMRWSSRDNKKRLNISSRIHFDDYSLKEESKENMKIALDEDVQFLGEVPSPTPRASIHHDKKSLGAVQKSLHAPKAVLACKPDWLDPSLAAAREEDEVQLVKVVNTSTRKQCKENVFKSPNSLSKVNRPEKFFGMKRFSLIMKGSKKTEAYGSDKESTKQHSSFSSAYEHYFGPKNSEKRVMVTRGLSGKKRSFVINECVRLEDKMRYQQLLQQYTTTPVLPSAYTVYKPLLGSSHFSSSGGETGNLTSSGKASILTQRLDVGTTAKLKESIDRQRFTALEASTTTEMKSSTKSKAVQVDRSKEVTPRMSSEKQAQMKEPDIQVIKADVSTMKCNSLEETLAECHPYSHDWLEELHLKYDAKERERRCRLEEEQIKKKVLTENREDFEKMLEERIRRQMRITGVVLEEEEEEEEEMKELELSEITDEMDELISDCLESHPPDEVLCEAFKIQIRRRDTATLAGLNWLNDEIINFYLSMIMERGKLDNFPSVYTFNTFFYPKLMSGGHAALKRWTRRVDVFSYDMILVPVHLGMHWCLAVIDFRNKYVKYYDSMGGSNSSCLEALLDYLQAESMDKKKTPYSVSEWTTADVKDIPHQMNGSDCGMFTLKYAEYVSRDKKITFAQQDMPYFRRRMVYEIVKQKLLYP